MVRIRSLPTVFLLFMVLILTPAVLAAETGNAARNTGNPVNCADITLERPYHGSCMRTDGTVMTVTVAPTDTAQDHATGDSITEGVMSGDANARQTAPDGPERAAERPHGIFSGISNAASRAVSVVTALFNGGQPPQNMGATDARDMDSDGDGLALAENTDEAYALHARGVVSAVHDDGTVTIDINSSRPGLQLKKGDRVALVGFDSLAAKQDGNTARFDRSYGVINPDHNDTAGTHDAVAHGQLTLTAAHVGTPLSAVWDGAYTAQTTDGSLLLEWRCTAGSFHAYEFYGPDTLVTRTTTAQDHHTPASPPVSHAGFGVASTSSTVSPSATWQISSDHSDTKPPADCNAVITDVTGEPVLTRPPAQEQAYSVDLAHGEIQIAAESSTRTGHAAVYRLVSGENQLAQVAYGTLHLVDAGTGTPVHAPIEPGHVTSTSITDRAIADTQTATLDQEIWHSTLAQFAERLHAHTAATLVETDGEQYRVSVHTINSDSTVAAGTPVYQWRLDGDLVSTATGSSDTGNDVTVVTLTLTDAAGAQLNKAELIEAIATTTDRSLDTADRIVDALLELTAETVKRDGNGGIDIGIKTKS